MPTKYQVTIPDLTLDEAIKMVEKAGLGSVVFSDEDGKPVAIPEHHQKLIAWPRFNAATIEVMDFSSTSERQL